MQEDHQGSDPRVLAHLRASNGRRVLGMTALCGLGGVLIYSALWQDNATGLRVVLIAAGVLAFVVAHFTWHGTASGVELTTQGLRDADGTVIAALGDIEQVDRGMFAFKPSNGFNIRLASRGATIWRLGLWWRYGRRVGVGGMTPVHQSKVMAELLAQLVAERAQDPKS